MQYLGFDIGGTKSAVVMANSDGKLLHRAEISTETPEKTLGLLFAEAEAMQANPCAIGFSCGGPLDEETGIILSPPNLPGWNSVPVTAMARERFGVPAALRNDANACAVAEWRYGAGRGTRNMIFLTFGTGLGAGIILNGRLYFGTNGNAGEVGHIRLADDGPIGYGKRGSFEGYCSGGGIAQIGKLFAEKAIREGNPVSFCPNLSFLDTVTAKTIAEAAYQGDEIAKQVYALSARKLGEGLSILIDLLNPECIVIGSIFARAESLFRADIERVTEAEALPLARKVCRVLPAELGDRIGDYAAIAVAKEAFERGGNQDD